MTKASLCALVVATTAALTAACQLDREGLGLAPSGVDVGGHDASVSPDARPDSAGWPDAPPKEASPDAPSDVAADGTEEASLDAPIDAPQDVLDDVPQDAPVDAVPDAPEDAAPDAPEDAAPDAPEDAAEDGPADAVSEPDGPVLLAGTALSFEHSANHYVEIGDIPVPQDFTIEAWIHPVGSPGETYIVAKDTSGKSESQFRLGLTGNEYLFFIMSDAAGDDVGLWSGGYVLVSPAAIPMNAWTHVAVVKQVLTFRLVVDGVEVASVNATSDPVHGGSQPVRIGARQKSDGKPEGTFDGIIDEVRLFSIARTAADIAAERSTPLSATSPWWPGLVGYWRLDEGVGTEASDERGAHPGTLFNDPAWVESDAF